MSFELPVASTVKETTQPGVSSSNSQENHGKTITLQTISPSELPPHSKNAATDMLCTENLFLPNIPKNCLLDKLYSLRYVIVRTFFVPLPALPRPFTILSGKSALDLVLYAGVFIAAIYKACGFVLVSTQSGSEGEDEFEDHKHWNSTKSSFGEEREGGSGIDGASAGSFASTIGFLVILLGLRNNFLTTSLGISFERALFFHKLTSFILIAVSIIHGIACYRDGDEKSKYGVILTVLFGAIGMSYMFKFLKFELFHFLHVAMYICSIAFAKLHGAGIYTLSIIPWVLDLAIRYFVRAKMTTAKLELLDADVIRVTVPRKFAFSAGQYCFLMFSDVTIFQYHPFTIASAPHEPNIVFYIRVIGDWTRSLKALIQSKANLSPDCLAETSLTLFLEGPYGIPSIDINGGYYEVLLLVSGGLGITPSLSFFKDQMERHRKVNSKIRKCILIWSVREASLVNAVSLSSSAHAQIGDMPFSLDADLSSKEPFHVEIYTTNTSTEEGVGAEKSNVFFKEGRPRMNEIFARVSEFCAHESIARVGVVGCGPRSMMDDVIEQCRRTHEVTKKDKSKSTVAFDMHLEEFDF